MLGSDGLRDVAGQGHRSVSRGGLEQQGELGGGESRTWNCGYGVGTSVLEVMAAAEKVLGKPVAYDLGPRRAGDPPSLVAATDAIRRALPWTPTRMDVAGMLASAIAWERRWTG